MHHVLNNINDTKSSKLHYLLPQYPYVCFYTKQIK
ncbi:hypothetical protein [Flavobacterium yafengii]